MPSFHSPKLPIEVFSRPLRHFKSAIPLSMLCLSLSCEGATVVYEDYEDKTEGSNTYSGGWTFVHADPAYSTTPVSSLNIEKGPVSGSSWGVGGAPDGLASPAGGNYLSYSTGAGGWTAGNAWNWQTDTYAVGTFDPWESSAGHLYRVMKLDAGTTYTVGLWRQVQISAASLYGAGNVVAPEIGFSVWNAADLNQANPQLSKRIAFQDHPYDPSTGEWQRVDLTFTTVGLVGGPQVDIAFTMGTYAATAPPPYYVEGMDMDGNPRTADFNINEYSYLLGYFGYYSENSRYSIDGFEISTVPEPGSFALVVASLMGTAFRRRR